jgi:hypothetical protein
VATHPDYFRTTQQIELRPVTSPTPEQIRFVQDRNSYLGNFLHIRERLVAGGLRFGPHIPERIEAIGNELRDLGLPFDIRPSTAWFDTRYNCFIYGPVIPT